MINPTGSTSNTDYRSFFINEFGNLGKEERYQREDIIHLDLILPEGVWLIKKGRVKQVFYDIEGYEKTILILCPGDMFGEITLFQNDNNMVVSEALEYTVVMKIDKDVFLNKISESPIHYHNLLLMITRKVRIMMHQMRDLSFRSIDGRLANLLLRLSEQQGLDTADGKVIDLYLTHQEIANMISATRAAVSRAIDKLRKERVIIIKNNKKIIILDLKKLAEKANL